MNPLESFRPFPVKRKTKRPLVKWAEFQHREPTDEEFAEWKAKWPDCWWGLPTGERTGIVVLDIDVRNEGFTSLVRLGDERPLPQTFRVETGSGGWHFYFAYPKEGIANVNRLLPGIDLRGDGGYVVVPPSSGYSILRDVPVAPMPAWLIDHLVHGKKLITQGNLDVAEVLKGVSSGERQSTAVRLAGRFIAKGLNPAEVLSILRDWNKRNTPPLDDEAELMHAVKSCVAMEQRNHAERWQENQHSNGDVSSNGGALAPEEAKPFETVSFDQVALRAVTWAWEGYVPLRGLTLVAGQPGRGKSTLAIYMCARASKGELEGDFFGQPIKSLIISQEDPREEVMKARVRAAGADEAYIRTLLTKLVSFPQDLERLRKTIEATDAKVVVLDPITAVMSSRIDTHRDSHVRQVLSVLADIAEQKRIAIVSVAHLNKREFGDFYQRVGGSIAWTAAARSVLIMLPIKESDEPQDEQGEKGEQEANALGGILTVAKSSWAAQQLSRRYFLRSTTLPAEDGGKPIKTSLIEVDGVSDYMTEDLLRPEDTPAERTKLEDAVFFLKTTLVKGLWYPAEDVKLQALEEEEISDSTLRRARLEIPNFRIAKDAQFKAKSYWAISPKTDRPEGPKGTDEQSKPQTIAVAPQPNSSVFVPRDAQCREEEDPCAFPSGEGLPTPRVGRY